MVNYLLRHVQIRLPDGRYLTGVAGILVLI